MTTDSSSYKKLRLVPFRLVLVVTRQFRLCVNREPPPPSSHGVCGAWHRPYLLRGPRGFVVLTEPWEAWYNHRVGPRLPALRLFFHPGRSIHRLFHQCAEWALLKSEIIILQCDAKEANVMTTDDNSYKKLRLEPFR